jgi:hypothetical protein
LNWLRLFYEDEEKTEKNVFTSKGVLYTVYPR